MTSLRPAAERANATVLWGEVDHRRASPRPQQKTDNQQGLNIELGDKVNLRLPLKGFDVAPAPDLVKRVNVSIERLVRRFYDELWNAWDNAAVEQVLAPEFVFRGSMGTETSGVDGWRSYRDAIRKASPDFHNQIMDLVAASKRAPARLRYTGTHVGTLAGVPATGRRFEYVGAAFFTSVDGKLTSAWVLGDLDGLRRQLH
jgi:steroid delta-isomerase-like uncharacterized protein